MLSSSDLIENPSEYSFDWLKQKNTTGEFLRKKGANEFHLNQYVARTTRLWVTLWTSNFNRKYFILRLHMFWKSKKMEF